MRPPTRILVFDCGASHVAGAEISVNRAGQLTLERFGFEVHGCVPGGERSWAEATAGAMAELAAREKLRGDCVLGLPGWVGLVKLGRTPSVAPAARGQVIRFEVERNIPHPLNEVVWDWRALADDGTEMEFVLSAAKASEVNELCRAVLAAGFSPLAVGPAGLALQTASRMNFAGDGQHVLVVDIGARSTQLLFLRPDGRFFLRTLTLAGNTITQAVADEQQIDFTSAEAVKRELFGGRTDLPADSPLRDAVQRAAANFTHRLQLELARALAAYAKQTAGESPGKILLTGGGAMLPGLGETLAEKLALPVERYSALEGVKISARAREDGVAAAHYLPVLIGLAADALRPAAQVINLLPAEFGAAVAFRRAQPWWLAGAALLLLGLLPPFWYWHTTARNARTELARLEQQLVPLRVAQYAHDREWARLEEIRQEGERLGRLAAARTSWLALLADLQAGLVAVEDVWLDRLQLLPAARGSLQGETTEPVLRLTLSGRLLDVSGPLAKVNPEANDRVRRLLEKFRESRFVREVVDERFDASEAGILRFDFTLVMKPEEVL